MSKRTGYDCDVCGKKINVYPRYKFVQTWYNIYLGYDEIKIKHMCSDCYSDFLKIMSDKQKK